MNRELIQSSIEIEAAPAKVWEVVSDLKRMGEWSPQCRKMYVLGGRVKKGTRTLNINHQGKLFWPTNAKVIEFEPEKKLAFRIAENRTVWSYELEPTATGTRITESRKAPHGVSRVSNFLAERGMGGIDRFEVALEKGIDKTLTRIKSEVEG
ncbi:MAG: SRPBCC family protein [Propionibacteriales bacterium]|nr:SRPBCC family protein [Propionibacteriales bacterium]